MDIVNVDGRVLRQRRAFARNEWFVNHFQEAKTNGEIYYPLSPNEKKEIADFWDPYGFAIKNNEKIQWIFSRASGIFDPSYMGFGTQFFLLNTFWNHYSYTYCRSKINMPFVFCGIKCPATVVCNNYGFYQDAHRDMISLDQALLLTLNALKDEPELLIKPSQEGEGVGINFIKTGTDRETIKKLFLSYSKDFIVQKVVKNHKSISDFYSGSLNTFRVSSLSWKGVLYYNGAVLRIGQAGRVDNAMRGGVFVRVNQDGTLGNYALNEQGNVFYEHPVSKIKFEGYKIPGFQKVIDFCKKIHGQIPQQRILSLDIALDDSGEPILIETNSPGGTDLLQFSGINAYHNRTLAKEIFDEYLKKKFFILNRSGDYTFREFDDHVSIVKYNGSKLLCEVPDTLAGKPVLKIYDNAFQGTLVKMVVMSSKIISDPHAFDNGNKQIVVESI